MNKRVKQKWLKALRSGEYRQGTKQLESRGAFCCLGVLEDLYRTAEQVRWTRHASSKGFHSKDCAKWSGLETARDIDYAALSPRKSTVKKLVNMNDDGKTFPEIANWIEENL